MPKWVFLYYGENSCTIHDNKNKNVVIAKVKMEDNSFPIYLRTSTEPATSKEEQREEQQEKEPENPQIPTQALMSHCDDFTPKS